MPQWISTAGRDDAEALAAVFDRLAAQLREHLADEEQHILPAAAHVMTQTEWHVLRARGEVAVPKRRGLIFLAAILEDTDPAEQA